MIQTADIREWRNQDVVDPGGHKIGELESVYVDLVLIIVAIVLGLIGAVADGLLFLLFVGIAVLVADLLYMALRTRRSARRRPLR
ncbi:hypothetical protein RKD23_003622 [Streptomyces sp. SAI-170]